MIALVMVVGDEFRDRSSMMALAERNCAVQTFLLIGRTNRSAQALALGARYGVCTTRIPASCKRARTALLHLASHRRSARDTDRRLRALGS
jgi:hypothetical protein